MIECVQEVRKSIQSRLSSHAKAHLKSHHRLLNPPADALNVESRNSLHILSPDYDKNLFAMVLDIILVIQQMEGTLAFELNQL
ncbi:hypothetical protein J2Z65_006387 [Paenibacillus aceris]|uniref:Uncharacterized protein n=1 Tax=Paenibacillus aceris TaxID=869555 RepID=A0ABS4I895_9BACL|nr:hypothetical protein [Paenibacillus aceris]